MKQGLFTLGLSVALSIMAGCRSQQEGWKLVWEENFDQEDHFDEASWSKIPRGKSDWNNYMSDFDSCYTMRDGNLVLRGLVNYSLPADTAPFITGGVYTKGKVGFSDGRLDIRAKLYGATGAWPAFWLLPENIRPFILPIRTLWESKITRSRAVSVLSTAMIIMSIV